MSFTDTSASAITNLETSGKPGDQARKWGWWWPPLAYFVLTLVLTWPLALHLGDSIPRGEPDSWQSIWDFWWMRHSLFERQANPFSTQLLFYPYRVDQPLSLYIHHLLQPLISVPAGLLSYVTGYALAYNLVILIGFTTAGWAMYALANYFIGNRVAAFVAGAFYTFSIFHWHNLSQGQPMVFWSQWLPLYILLLHKSFSYQFSVVSFQSSVFSKIVNHQFFYPVLAGLTLALTTYTDLYYTLHLLLYSAIFFGWRLLQFLIESFKSQGRGNLAPTDTENHSIRPPSSFLLPPSSFLLLFGLWAVLVALPIFGLLTHRNDPAIKYAEEIQISILQSAAVPSLFTPSRGADRSWLPFFIGFTTLALATLGVWQSKRRGWWWLTLALGGLVMTLGPYLRFDQRQVEEALQNLPLPYLLLSELPLVNNSRSPVRFMGLAQVGLCLLAGWGIVWLSIQVARWKVTRRFAISGVAVLVLLVFFLETNSLPLNLEKLPQPALFAQIKNEPSNYALLELPLTGHYIEDTRRMYYQALHEHPISSGYIARKVFDYQRDPSSPFGYFFDIFPPKAEPIFLSENQPTPLRMLNFYNFRYVINYRNDYKAGSDWQFSQAEKYLQELFGRGPDYQDELMTAYRLASDPAKNRPIFWRTAGFSEAEKRGDGVAFRWANGDRAFVDVITPEAGNLNLKFSAWSFGKEDDLKFLLNGTEIGRLHITTAPQDYTLNLKLPAGSLRLEIRSTEPARLPADFGGSASDRRQLSFALAQLGV